MMFGWVMDLRIFASLSSLAATSSLARDPFIFLMAQGDAGMGSDERQGRRNRNTFTPGNQERKGQKGMLRFREREIILTCSVAQFLEAW